MEALMRELYKEDFAKAAKDPAAVARLAATLLQDGKDTNDSPAGRFVLLGTARDLAAQAGDGPTALQAIDELAASFDLDAAAVFQMKTGALYTASKAVATPEAYHTVLDAALVLLEDALALDNYDAAAELVKTAEAAAVKLRNVPLVTSVRKRQDEVKQLQSDYAKWKPYADRLAKDATDAEANTQMGKYHAFRKNNWELGLVLLSRGSHEGLKRLADLDVRHPNDAATQIKLADGWLAGAGQAPEPAKTPMLLRAYHWYQQAVYDLDEASRGIIEKKMQTIMDQVPSEYRVGEIAAEVKRFEGYFGPIYGTAFSPDGRKAVSGGADHSLRLWDTKTGKEIRRLDGHTNRVWTVAFAPDGRRVASGGFDGTIRLWDLAAGRDIRRFPGHGDYVRCVVFASDGKRILSAGDDRLLRLWNTDSGAEIRQFKGHDHFVWSAALSRDGKRAASGSLDKTVRLWDVDSGNELKRLSGHADTVLSVALSPDGRRILSASTDGAIKLWDAHSGKELRTLSGHKGYVHSVAFSPDGRRALSAGADHTVRLWDVLTGEEIRKLEGHRDQVWHVTFSRDGRLAVSCGQDATARVWGGAR